MTESQLQSNYTFPLRVVMLSLPRHIEKVKGQFGDIKRKMWVHGVNKDLWTSCLACGVLTVFERIQDGVDDSGSLLF